MVKRRTWVPDFLAVEVVANEGRNDGTMRGGSIRNK